MSLTEVLIAAALIGIGILGGLAAVNGIQTNIQYSKARALATNLAQEKMQIVMQKSYYEILVTTSPAYRVLGSSSIAYDPSYFPPEAITEGSINFTRLTDVQVVQENSGVIQVLPPETPDTGMRQITITILWQGKSDTKSLSVQNVINNPNTVMANAVVSGQVTDATTGNPIPGALVDAAENIGWRDSADIHGNYQINLAPGTFDFVGSAQGYYPHLNTLTISPNSNTTTNYALVPISSGIVQGTAWVNTHVVISEVVASTGSSNDVEYIELYNPTTSQIPVVSYANSPWIYYIDRNSNLFWPQFTYVTANIPAMGYYLMANTTTVTLNGIPVAADAYYNNSSPYLCPAHLITAGESGGLQLWIYTVSGGWGSTGPADTVGWSKTSNGHLPPASGVLPSGSSGIPSNGGLAPGEEFVRQTDTGAVTPGYGRAYNASINSSDFVDYAGIGATPNNSSVVQAPITGAPAAGAYASVTDGLSASVTTYITGNPPYAQFSIPGVATGTWVAYLDTTNGSSAEIDNVLVAQSVTTSIPNGVTAPTAPATGLAATIISSNSSVGTISGVVTNIAGGIISPAIIVTAGGNTATTGVNGRFTLRLSTGTYDVTANPSNTNSSYETQTQPSVGVTLGDLTGNINFSLAQSGKITGWITRDGTNPLPGVSVVALDSNGQAHDTEITGTNGSFTLINLTTGAYTVEPVLDPKETSSPSSTLGTVTVGTSISVGTFTVVGAMGTVTGAVTVAGQPIQTGVLVVISTATISTPPPTLNNAALTGAAFYADSSKEDGTYAVDVRGSSTTIYHAAAFYMHIAGTTAVISSQTVANINVTAGAQTPGVNFAW